MDQCQRQDGDRHQPAEHHVGIGEERLCLLEMDGVQPHIAHGDRADRQRRHGEDEACLEKPSDPLLKLLVAEIADGQQTGHHAGAENEVRIVFGRILDQAKGGDGDIEGQQAADQEERYVDQPPQPFPDSHRLTPLAICLPAGYSQRPPPGPEESLRPRRSFSCALHGGQPG